VAATTARPATAQDVRSLEPWEDFWHTGPGTLAGRYLRSFWQPVYRSQDLTAGRAMPVTIMSEHFTLYRGEEGAPHAVAFRCAHRGTQLSTGWVEGDNLRCFYHGWVYDPDGQCVEQPAEPEPFCDRIRIRAYPTVEYLGLIFVYMGEGDPPPMWHFGGFEDETEGVRENYTYTWPCNVFNSLENDPFHGLWVHRESYLGTGRVGIPEVTCEETEYGYCIHQRLPSDATHWRESQSHLLMPNVSYGTRTAPELGREAWRDAVAWRVPVDDEHFASFGTNMTHVKGEARARYEQQQRDVAEKVKGIVPHGPIGERVLRGELRLEDVEDRHVDGSRLFNMQDYVSQVGQGTIADREHEHLGREDVTVIMLRNLWKRELRALAEGRPLKQWTQPDSMTVVVGAPGHGA
jgi:5,5'-dehydrodivanillate O-demethylase